MTRIILFVFIVALSFNCFGSSTFCQQDDFSEETLHVWPTIPFISGADYYNFQNAYSQNRNENRLQRT